MGQKPSLPFRVLGFDVTIDLLKSDGFEFFLPLDINLSKSQKFDIPDTKKTDGHSRILFGVASTEDTDLQNEIVYQRGINFSYFLAHGYYNNDHKPGFENKVGQPLEARVTPEGLWTRGYLWEPGVHKVADAIWELANALIASDSDRKLGFSIQGKVVRRDGKRILSCWVQDVAITAAPINTNTWIDVVKSLSEVPAEMWCDHDSGLLMPEQTAKSVPCVCKKPCGMCKSLASSFQDKDIDLRKREEEEEEKALSAGSEAGRVLTPESLEGGLADQQWGHTSSTHEKVNKGLSFDDCVDLLQKVRGFSRTESITLAEAVFTMNRTN
jgi:hypothetical protein